jgi:hypothetical protein
MSGISWGTTLSSGPVPISAWHVVCLPIHIDWIFILEVPACFLGQYVRGQIPEYRWSFPAVIFNTWGLATSDSLYRVCGEVFCSFITPGYCIVLSDEDWVAALILYQELYALHCGSLNCLPKQQGSNQEMAALHCLLSKYVSIICIVFKIVWSWRHCLSSL